MTPDQPDNDGSSSFITAVINAIRKAAPTTKERVNKLNSISQESADGAEMLDSETEPCLMIENVLESMPDSHTQNLISSNDLSPVGNNDQEDSLQMLCEAITNRQQIEQQTSLMLMNRSMETNISNKGAMIVPVQSLIDHVINVDNLVTKLLKVLHNIQL